MLKVLLLSAFLCLRSPLAAATAGYCEDMWSSTCAPGAAETSPFIDPDKKFDAAIESLRDKYVEEFAQMLGRPESKNLRDIVLTGLHYDLEIECQAESAVNRNICNKKAAEGLFELAAAKMSEKSSYKLPGNIAVDVLDSVTADPGFRAVSERMRSDLFKLVVDENLQNKISADIFPDAKARVLSVVENLPLDEVKKEKLRRNVKAVNYAGSDCTSNEDPSSLSLDADLWVNALFKPEGMKVSFCDGMLFPGQSEFAALGILAHEIGHSIDPCMLEEEPAPYGMSFDNYNLELAESQYPLSNLLKCVRNEKSLHAGRDDGGIGRFIGSIIGQDRIFCGLDQVGESVADWFMTEVLASYAKEKMTENIAPQVASVFRYACGKPVRNGFNEHAPVELRVNNMLIQNPTIRGLMGCPPSRQAGYCDARNTEPQVGAPIPPDAVLRSEGIREGIR